MHEGKQKGHEDACWMLLQPKEMDFVLRDVRNN